MKREATAVPKRLGQNRLLQVPERHEHLPTLRDPFLGPISRVTSVQERTAYLKKAH